MGIMSGLSVAALEKNFLRFQLTHKLKCVDIPTSLHVEERRGMNAEHLLFLVFEKTSGHHAIVRSKNGS